MKKKSRVLSGVGVVGGIPLILTRNQVAELAHLCTRSVRRAERAGELRCFRPNTLGGSQKALYRREHVLAWLGIGDVGGDA